MRCVINACSLKSELHLFYTTHFNSKMASDSCDDEYEETLLLMTLLRRRLRRRVCKRSVWVRAIFTERHKQGDYHNLIQEM